MANPKSTAKLQRANQQVRAQGAKLRGAAGAPYRTMKSKRALKMGAR